MCLYVASLNSGSNGNCYYIGNNEESVLIDAGLSCREVEKRMRRMGLPIQNLKAIFISHEHSDHIKGVTVLSQKYQLPVYITDNTMKHGRVHVEKHLHRNFNAHEEISIGELIVTAFPKKHDAIDPYSFIVKGNEQSIGIFTDIGLTCDNLVRNFRQCNAAFLEANYDTKMLENGKYPWHLKNRIRGGYGHLSNTQALELFTTYKPDFMSHLFLAHLSRENNCPDLVHELFSSCAGSTEIIVASRYGETAIYTVGNLSAPIMEARHSMKEMVQASLF